MNSLQQTRLVEVDFRDQLRLFTRFSEVAEKNVDAIFPEMNSDCAFTVTSDRTKSRGHLNKIII